VNADAGQLEQVLLNLATNARDAMPNGGALSLRTELVDPASAGGPAATDELPAYALITVADTGIGMDGATREKIFEPFFTTKELGRGTGLGLAMVYGIIRQHGGQIECASEPGKGTTFRIRLPLTPTKEEGVTTRRSSSATAALPRGSETILVVEDDKAVRTLSRIVLETFGYAVIEAVDGEEAIALYRKHRDTIRLVLCDVIMPKKSGAEVHKAIVREAPDARFLFMSGYPADIVRRQDILKEGTGHISKPITPSTLLHKVREALDRT
jgi:CheY-like chemotaxis protein